MSDPRHIVVCRARCSPACLHGQPSRFQLRAYETFIEHPQVHYPAGPGYAIEDAAVGASIVCAACLQEIDGPVAPALEAQAIERALGRQIIVRDSIVGVSSPDPHIVRRCTHPACGWTSTSVLDTDADAGHVAQTMTCPICQLELPTLVDFGNNLYPPDLQVLLTDAKRAASGRRDLRHRLALSDLAPLVNRSAS